MVAECVCWARKGFSELHLLARVPHSCLHYKGFPGSRHDLFVTACSSHVTAPVVTVWISVPRDLHIKGLVFSGGNAGRGWDS